MKKTAAVIIGAAAVLLAAAFFFYVPKELSCREASRLQAEGKTAEAYEKLKELGNWRDSAARAKELEAAYPGIAFSAAGVWDTVTFGEYEQDGDPGDGAEPLEWYVLYRTSEEDGDRLLLLSRYCLACMAYHSRAEEVGWEDSDMRAFLNGPFCEAAFSGEEQALIVPTANADSGEEKALIVPAANAGPGEEEEGSPAAETGVNEPDEDVHDADVQDAAEAQPEEGDPHEESLRMDPEDMVFLLDRLETSVYFPGEEERWMYARAEATRQAVLEGIYVSEAEAGTAEAEEAGYSRWWLRSTGNEPYSAQFVEEDGNVFEGGAAVDIDYIYGLRPALWVRCPSF